MPEILQGPAREPLDRSEIEALRSSVIIDESRRRPLYFDGRFLAARDLVREQSYFLTRQADLGRAGGTGVVRGLMVERGEGTRTLRISAGHGLTAAGEPVMLPTDLVVKLDDLPQIQRLDLTLGLLEIPREPVRNRSGVYIVALRPVEFTANPVASYPTSVDGQRGVEDGDIIEGTVVTLIPYPDAGSGTADERRARAAYDIFVRGGKRGSPAPVLPLAMVQLNLNTVVWVDPFMVRREVAQERGDILGVGFAPRELRESHVLQYDHHLREVLRARGGLRQRFAASEYFRALPPAGRMPAATIAGDFTQIFFPPTVEVDLTIVPADEVPALLEESFLLPPIDLTRSAEELDAVSVAVLIPVPRDQFASTAQALQSLQRPLPPATPWMLARRQPIDVLRGLRLPATLITPASTPAIDARWTEELNKVPVLWYTRRRHLASRAGVTGVPVNLSALRDRLDEAAGNPARATLNTRPGVADGETAGGAAAETTTTRSTPTEETAGTLGVRPPGSFEAEPEPSPPAPAPGATDPTPDAAASGSATETTAATPVRAIGELTLSPTVLSAIRGELLAAASAPAAPSGTAGTAESGTVREVTLSPTLTTALRDAVAGATLTAAPAAGETATQTISAAPAGSATLPPTLTRALAEAVTGATSTPAGETEPGTAHPAEVTLSPTLAAALRQVAAATTPTLSPDATPRTASGTGTTEGATDLARSTPGGGDAGTLQPATDVASTTAGNAATVDTGLVAPSGEPLRDAVRAEATLASATPSRPAPVLTSALAQAVIEAVRKEEAAGKEVPVASDALLSDPAFGSGLAKLEEARPELARDTRAITNLARSGVVQELDQLAATHPAAELADEVVALAASRTRTAPTKLASAIRSRLPEGGAR